MAHVNIHCFKVELIILLALISTVQATNHYCVDKTLISLSISSDTEQYETLLTNVRDENRYFASQKCHWEVTMKDLREPHQLLLQPRLGSMRRGVGVSSAAADSLNCPTELTVTVEDTDLSRKWHNNDSLPKIPLVIPMTKSSQQVSVRFTTGALEPSADCNRVELSIRVAKKGYCARNMLLHDGSCHFVSDGPLRLRDLKGTGAALAAFSGTFQLRQFIRDNLRTSASSSRQEKHTNLQAGPRLDLSGPVRVGIFRCSRSPARLFYWHRKGNNGSCRAKRFQSNGAATNYSAHGLSPLARSQCAFLEVTSASRRKFALGFSNCATSMRYLISFPETPLAGSEENLSAALKACELIRTPVFCRHSVRTEPNSSKASAIFYLIIAYNVILLLAFAVLLAIFMCRNDDTFF